MTIDINALQVLPETTAGHSRAVCDTTCEKYGTCRRTDGTGNV
ncbi:ALQxL family class IV lanthipeptide [Microtetraspora sp. AC03309]|nr:ALQxL family class IV lanthipeptide [Microtetraspora sp. AC03309]MCC5581142.1 ALQxL family class IV lanthipeptide [Microtetraspora sp. AC03309]